MKFIYLFLIFVIGFAVGRWSVHDTAVTLANTTQAESPTSQFQSNPTVVPTQKVLVPKNETPVHESTLSENTNLIRTDDKTRDKQIRQLFSQLMEANEKDQVEEQNRIFREMESLNPQHETIFQARAMFLQDDEDWQGAHDVLKECITAIPNSIYCLRRLANIRSSTTDEKLSYGGECLQVSKNDPLCLVDMAMALQTKGEFIKAKEYFEQALNLPHGNEGYNKDYLLYQYAHTLKSLGLHPKAKAALAEASRLNMKSACIEIQKM